MRELSSVLAAFHEATRCEAAVWMQVQGGAESELTALAAVPAGATAPSVQDLPSGGPPVPLPGTGGQVLASCVPGPLRAWLTVGPCASAIGGAGCMKFLLPVVSHYLQAALEVEHAANELAERYEEINLLYTISEILGRTVTLEEAASTILTEISETVGARRGSILVHDRVTDTLQAVAALGVRPESVPPISIDDGASASALVFREQHGRIIESGDMPYEAETPYRRGSMLSVPIMWTTPDGGEPLGVVNLSDRRSGQPFSAGDQKLVAAIATQIGTAIQNARLVRASLTQQRLVQEMQLAHDLQMKLLPDTSVVAPEAQVAARVIPAESVGGDFYHLFRLGASRTGVMIGDVSGHGYRAALIMALVMSASAIHAQTTGEPAETLRAVLTSLRDEFASTEMFVSAFFGVIDRERGVLNYANTGHPHAFIVGGDGSVERLTALDPPLGMVDTPPSARARPWRSGEDLLLLFTDGVAEARKRDEARAGEQEVVETVCRFRNESPAQILERIFDALQEHSIEASRRDDLTLLILRS